MTLVTIDWLAVMRMTLVFAHVLAMAAACAGIAFGDYAIFARERIDAALLRKSASAVTAALLALWVTGLTIIWLDIGFDLIALAAKPKLLAKLTIVTLLSLNGVALHYVGFTRLCVAQAQPLNAARVPAVLGAISVVTWLYAAFAGLAKPLALALGYSGFLTIYLLVICLAIIVALAFMRPHLAQRMARSAPEQERDLARSAEQERELADWPLVPMRGQPIWRLDNSRSAANSGPPSQLPSSA